MEINRKPIHLKEDELISRLPEQIGRVRLEYSHYPGKDLYSDGAIEEELLAIVKDSSRVEFPSIIEQRNSWPILYHLSPLRANIVDWLPITKEHKVLEIGSGCGAITDKLSEKAGEVTCVELSARRSEINARRNQDRDDIMIHVGNFKDIEPELPCDYDYICLIGVFEYAASYMGCEDPYTSFLKIMKKHLKKGGHIVIAIENKLGLKYFAGCVEDHLETWFSGLEGYPDGGSARTFSKPGLEEILRKCDISEYSFYYPYPDYKFPEILYSDRRLPQAGELTKNDRNFDHHRMQLFHEKYVYDGLIKDGLFPVFSNSFMIVTGEKLQTTYMKYSNDRAEQFRISTEIAETESGCVIRKHAMSEAAKAHIISMEESCKLLKGRYEGSGLRINDCKLLADGKSAQFPFEKGITLENLLDECLEKEDMDEFYRLFDKFLKLVSYGEESQITDYDLIFSNILVDQDQFTVIDYEWTKREAVTAKELAFRAVYCYVLEEEKRNKLNLDYIIQKLHITGDEAEEYRKREQKFQKMVTGKRKSMGELKASIGTYSIDAKKLTKDYLKEILDKRIQVYYDRGNGFSEADSCYFADVYTGKDQIETEIAFDGNVKALRIDPADDYCMVKIGVLELNGKEIPLNKKCFWTNGKLAKENTYVFTTMDPNMTILLETLPLRGENTLKLSMELIRVPKAIAENMSESIKKLF